MIKKLSDTVFGWIALVVFVIALVVVLVLTSECP